MSLKRYTLSLLLLIYPVLFASCAGTLDTLRNELPEVDSLYCDGQVYDTLTIAHWNIGHFSLGKSSNTTISEEQSAEASDLYMSLIEYVDADIIGICEYNPVFSAAIDNNTASLLFGNYPYQYIGVKHSYNCNAVFSRFEMDYGEEVLFPTGVSYRYYVETHLIIDNREVVFVETHLDWNESSMGKTYRAHQIQHLADEFSKYPFVVISADFNNTNMKEFRPLVDAGFSLANGGELGTIYTYPASNPKRAIDNIITKGFKILDFNVVADKKLSDHCLIFGRVVFINDNGNNGKSICSNNDAQQAPTIETGDTERAEPDL